MNTRLLPSLIVFAICCCFFFAAPASAQRYPWVLTVYGGGANPCISDEGCFTLSTPALGGSFGRAMSKNWRFELDGFWTRGTQDLGLHYDATTGTLYDLTMKRTRTYGGIMFLGTVGQLTSKMDLFLAFGAVGAVERQQEQAPAGIFHAPSKNIGVKGGLAGGVGLNWWFSQNWGVRPEARFYAVVNGLSTLRYTAGIMRKF